MKLLRFEIEGIQKIGSVEGNAIASLTDRLPSNPDEMVSLIRNWSDLRAEAEGARGRMDYDLSDVALLAPIARPGKIFGIGLNYADHAAEAGGRQSELQTWFSKAATAVNAPFGNILLPAVSSALDYEGELVAVVGQGGKHLTKELAATAIFGYCVGNDVSVRDWQIRTGQFVLGKSFDTHAPFGPWIVTADEIDPSGLSIRSYVNGDLRQSSNTGYMIFDCAAQLSHLSEAMTMEPGDLLFTGTPAGVGAAMTPPNYLKCGDIVRVEIEGIGAIENVVAEEKLAKGALNNG